MERRNLVLEKSYDFALRVIKMYQHLSNEKKEFILSKQVLRSGTSIGANVEEAIGGHTKKDFASKLAIAYKEARETSYWLRLLKDTQYINPRAFQSIYKDCDELLRLLYSIIKTSKTQTA
ncbi:four helix bundle protein [Fulvivirgaceae bacterium BMA10]|uniref:Four helix bundle protein n=1 Tax=Splendidivirga corallicola TaxID=3051826 RepID=A0ABT8KV24_9BACT|nr:four helix bundle protein [Fulvivirgaceae bacterium BMA10]